eukprot:CAMPEP_0118666514 /NCGR_PEP_ID=MMETSP0785-20121206/19257_1 /TAXON_ID=91992 /ORGANISM="Bolidomonas pacifica, Strain CCMP 1866" /LENGTH=264 /DNA_ID=CAMNT_0006560833 /DNA_START=29 /DNA_END=823 /DNA_ORIENTATION=+
MKSTISLLTFFYLLTSSSSFAPIASISRTTSLYADPESETTKTTQSSETEREALERQFREPSSPQTKNADGSFGEPKTGYSKALPFLARPKNLDGTFPGDAGFDPLGLGGSDKSSLAFMREAEIKHSRLAMLAVVGWPVAELFDRGIASAFDLPTMLTKTGASPSLLNGGLDRINPFYWAIVLSLGALVEYDNKAMKEKNGKAHIIGDCGYDILGLMPEDKAGKFERQTSEIKHGRIAMLAIVGYAAQEALYRIPITMQFPFNL